MGQTSSQRKAGAIQTRFYTDILPMLVLLSRSLSRLLSRNPVIDSLSLLIGHPLLPPFLEFQRHVANCGGWSCECGCSSCCDCMKNVVLRTPALYCIVSLEEPASLPTILWSCPDLWHESVACIVTGEIHKPSQEEVCDIIIIYSGGWGVLNWGIVSFRSCVRAVWLSNGTGSKNMWAALFPKLSGNESGLWSLCILTRSNLADFQETLW
jgi:hypothetical protein